MFLGGGGDPGLMSAVELHYFLCSRCLLAGGNRDPAGDANCASSSCRADQPKD